MAFSETLDNAKAKVKGKKAKGKDKKGNQEKGFPFPPKKKK